MSPRKKLMHSADAILASDESREVARCINERRQQAVQDRWFSTYLLHIHLEVEAMIEEALRQTLPKPERFLERNGTGPSFSQKLTLCSALDVLSDELVASIRGMNRLRNAFAHSPIQKVDSRELIKFLWADYALHPFQRQEDSEYVGFASFDDMLKDFEHRQHEDLVGLVLMSLDLIRAHLSSMFTDEAPERSND